MRLAYAIHILAGTLTVLFGYAALWSPKGAPLHRRAGQLFASVMLVTAVAGMTIAAVRGVAPAINIPAASLTAYLVVTSLVTVRPVAAWRPWMDAVALLVVLAVGASSLAFGVEAVAGGGTRKGMPAFPFFLFGVAGTLAAIGDVRVMRTGALRGAPRLTRHLWRMCFALFIAAISFFIGQSQVFPEVIRIPGLLALPVLAVLVTMVYWLWRVRVRRNLRGITLAAAGA